VKLYKTNVLNGKRLPYHLRRKSGFLLRKQGFILGGARLDVSPSASFSKQADQYLFHWPFPSYRRIGLELVEGANPNLKMHLFTLVPSMYAKVVGRINCIAKVR
jgi:hypothetical protein